jgi:broad-specificity NMP kinase
MTIIAVTGTPGTGKTTYALQLSKELSADYIDVNKVIEDYDLEEK